MTIDIQGGPSITIIGGGIAGLALALGLLHRGHKPIVYERASSLREIGAGIGFTPNAERAMKLLCPEIHAAFKKVAVQNASDYFRWMDGMTEAESVDNELIHSMYLGERGFEGCSRAQFLDELYQMLPDNMVHFSKTLVDIIQDEEKPVTLQFADGTCTTADVVIGCDGLRSTVRSLMFRDDSIQTQPTYTRKYAFRGLAPMEAAKQVLSDDKTATRHMYLGQDGHALTFPVANGQFLNIVAFTTDQHEWQSPDKLVAPAQKQDATAAFAGFNSAVRSIINLLPETLDKWAVFDTKDNLSPTFVKGKVCIIGDAAHAAAPYHGAGAGFAIEDALVLVELLSSPPVKNATHPPIDTALQVFNDVRYKRAKWLVESSRYIGTVYQWQDHVVGTDAQKCAQEIESRSRNIWDYNIKAMVQQAHSDLAKKLNINSHE